MRTLILLGMMLVPSALPSQVIPDVNTKLESEPLSPTAVVIPDFTGSEVDDIKEIPESIKKQMSGLVHVTGSKIDKYSAQEYSKLVRMKITSIEKRQKCARILVKIEDINNPCFIVEEQYYKTMVAYSDSLAKYRAIEDFFVSAFPKMPESPLTYDKGKTTVVIPQRLQNDMKELMGINGKYLDARGAYYNDIESRRRRDSLINKRNCTFIAGNFSNQNACKNKKSIRYLTTAAFNDEMGKLNDSIKRYEVLSDFFTTANSLGGSPKLKRSFAPVQNTMQAKYFFLDNTDEESIMFLTKVGLQSDFNEIYSANATLISGVVPIRWLPLKFSMATNITQQTSDNDSVAATKLTNGGLLNVGLLWPFFFRKWYVDNGKKATLYFPVEFRYNIDDIKDKVAFNDTYNYAEFSGYLMGTIDLLQKEDVEDAATLFAVCKVSYYNGSHQFSSTLSANKFLTAHASVGIQIKNKYTISANIPFWSNNDIIKKQQIATFGLTFQPTKKE